MVQTFTTGLRSFVFQNRAMGFIFLLVQNILLCVNSCSGSKQNFGLNCYFGSQAHCGINFHAGSKYPYGFYAYFGSKFIRLPLFTVNYHHFQFLYSEVSGFLYRIHQNINSILISRVQQVIHSPYSHTVNVHRFSQPVLKVM